MASSSSGPAGGRLIREARKRAGLSQRELAGRLKTSQSLVARWENGDVSPSFETVVRAVRACGLDLGFRITNYDHEHDRTIELNLRLDPAERLDRMLRSRRSLKDLVAKVKPVA